MRPPPPRRRFRKAKQVREVREVREVRGVREVRAQAVVMATCELAIRVIPRASKTGVAGTRGDAVLVRLAAAPVDGAANAELVDTLARALDLPRRAISITAGATARAKRVRVEGLTLDEALSRLLKSPDVKTEK